MARPAMDETTRGDRSTAAETPSRGRSLSLTIVLHPFAQRVGQRAHIPQAERGKPVAISRAAPLFAHIGASDGEPLGDDRLSRRPFFVVELPGGGVRVDLAETGTVVMHRGEELTTSRTFSPEEMARGVVLELGRRIVLLLHQESDAFALLSGGSQNDPEIGGESEAIRRVLWEIQSVADTPLPVLLRGETGSGKELVARGVHRMSPRRSGPFVAVNLGALTPTLAVSELFGAERGAFTGAVKKQVGYFDQARGGTLFLDEIGEAPVELQVALLRVLETGEMQTVGAQAPRKADVRIVAATDADLERLVAGGSFRAPLLNRLSGYEIRIPPLRERRDDVGRLLVRFLREELSLAGEPDRLASTEKPWLSSSMLARLIDFDWPGNVRQLRNVARQLVIGNRGCERASMPPSLQRLLEAALAPSVPAPAANLSASTARASASPPSALPPPPPVPGGTTAPPEPPPARRKPATVTESEMEEALRASAWDVASAAQKLGVSRASMYLLFERFPQFRAGKDIDTAEILAVHQRCEGSLSRMAEALRVSSRSLARRLKEMGVEYR